MKVIDGGVTAPTGFLAASAEAGIKYENRKDMALIYSGAPCYVAGTFTKNIVKAAPVIWDQDIVSAGKYAHAVVINAGVANACTGTEGLQYCEDTAEAAAQILNISCESVLVASTGVIGMQLPIDKIVKGVKTMSTCLGDGIEDGENAAKAIMTTDTVKKEIAVEFEINGKKVHIGGMCKGSGMIHPDMCTMLSFVTTDVNISPQLLKQALSDDVNDTYNMISVDGDTSTNDTVLLMANGLAGNTKIEEADDNYQIFCRALNFVNQTLAKKIAGDGEGCTALFEVKVTGAESKEQAVVLSKAVITSSLTKAAIFGHDANWGRILCAMGYSGAVFNPEVIDLTLASAVGEVVIMKDGKVMEYSEQQATKILSEPEVTALIDIKMGSAQATAWGCDLTYDYVKINADYRS